MKLVVDTGVFCAALSRRPRPDLEPAVARLVGNRLFIAVQTVAEQSCDDVCSLLVRAARPVVVALTAPPLGGEVCSPIR